MIDAWLILPALLVGAVGGYIAAAMTFAGKDTGPE